VNAGPEERAKQCNPLLHIVLKIFSWVFYGFAHIGEGREMDAGLNFIFFGDALERTQCHWTM
jgi:hypothetical protein